MVCFGNMFIRMPHPETKEMIEKGKPPGQGSGTAPPPMPHPLHPHPGFWQLDARWLVAVCIFIFAVPLSCFFISEGGYVYIAQLL